jgi:mRNA interferase YafQ
MREIERSNQFKRDYKRELKGQRGKKLPEDLVGVLNLLVADAALDGKYKDHPLTGEWKGYRDCHVWPDLVLIYSKPDAKTLRLVRLGSHSELFNE